MSVGSEAIKVSNPKVGGGVFRAPIGTTIPTSYDEALDAAFVALGYVGEHLVDAVLPPVAHARLLAMRAGQPCLLLTRRTFNAGQVVTWARLWHPADRYQLGGRFSRRSD